MRPGKINFLREIVLIQSACLLLGAPVKAQLERATIDFHKLNLTDQQNHQIDELDSQWTKLYGELKSAIVTDQSRVLKLLERRDSDSLEIMSLQEEIARKRGQLSLAATQNYLKKRELLDDNQKHSLETMMHQFVAEKRRILNVDESQSEMLPDPLKGLMQKVQSTWTTQADR